MYSKTFGGGNSHPDCRLASMRPPVFRHGRHPLWRLLGLPVVQAAETEVPETDAAATTMDKLAEAKPTILISDADVRNYLANETGMDRLREMFSKR